MLLAVIVRCGASLVSAKLALLVFLMWNTSPISSHLIGSLEYETNERLSEEVSLWKR